MKNVKLNVLNSISKKMENSLDENELIVFQELKNFLIISEKNLVDYNLKEFKYYLKKLYEDNDITSSDMTNLKNIMYYYQKTNDINLQSFLINFILKIRSEKDYESNSRRPFLDKEY